MPPRALRRQMPARMSRSPPFPEVDHTDPTLWPDEGSETDPEYVPTTDTESETDTDDATTDDSDTDDGSDTDDTTDSEFSEASDE